jgi:hypothetical protein
MLADSYNGYFGFLSIPNSQSPGTSPTPVITRGGTTTTVSIGPANVETPGSVRISSIGTASAGGVTLTFSLPTDIAVQQREVGTGLWGRVYGGQYANTWLNAPNIELPTCSGSISTGSAPSTAGSQPSAPSQPKTEPPKEETPAPEVPQEPVPTEPVSAGGEGPPMGGGEREGLTSGETGGQVKTGAGALVTDIKSNKSF